MDDHSRLPNTSHYKYRSTWVRYPVSGRTKALQMSPGTAILAFRLCGPDDPKQKETRSILHPNTPEKAFYTFSSKGQNK